MSRADHGRTLNGRTTPSDYHWYKRECPSDSTTEVPNSTLIVQALGEKMRGEKEGAVEAALRPIDRQSRHPLPRARALLLLS